MLYQELIRRKRDNAELTAAEIGDLVQGITDNSLGDAQLGALAMAVLLCGMTLAERIALTNAMCRSGDMLSWDGGPVVDKHSTGGIGDTVSLILAPALAACGALVPMIAGRGLGHTGGTIDKLESIQGYDAMPDLGRLRRIVQDVGCAIVGQSPALAPADRRLYAVRDVTATVESIDLITASILSKKLAAGLSTLVLDVKCGNGAFMSQPEQARILAKALVDIGNASGCRTVALMTDMNQPLAPAAGNALETALAIDVLKGGDRPARLWQVTLALGTEVLLQAGLCPDHAAACAALENAVASGAAADRFARMVSALGGPSDLLERPAAHLPRAPVERAVPAMAPGVIAAIDTRALGLSVIALGGGRRQPVDRIDPRVGLSRVLPLGTQVDAGACLAVVHAADEATAEGAVRTVQAAFDIGDKAVPGPLVLEQISG